MEFLASTTPTVLPCQVRAATMSGNLVDWQTPFVPAVAASRDDATDTTSARFKRAAMHSSSAACSAYFDNLRADGRVELGGLLR